MGGKRGRVMTYDLIRRSDAIKAMEQRYEDILRTFKRKVKVGEKAIALDMIGCIKMLPSADRPSGEWIPMTVSSGRDSWKCSVCGRRARGKIKNLPYCHCGARMKGADDEQSCVWRVMTIELSKVKAELNEWRYLIGDDVVDAIILNLEEEADEDEPQTETQTETQNSNLTFEKRTMRDCYNCKRYETEGECVECHYEPKDEPQTDCSWK